MAQREGYVSAWVGTFSDEEALFAYVEKDYSGDAPAHSEFLRAHPVGAYDEDFAEAQYFAGTSVTYAIVGHSYASSFAEALLADAADRPEFDSLYLIYDHDASDVAGSGSSPLQLLGVYPYDKRAE